MPSDTLVGLVLVRSVVFLPRKGGVKHRQCDGFPKSMVNTIRRSNDNGHVLKATGGRRTRTNSALSGKPSGDRSKGACQALQGLHTAAEAWALQFAKQGKDPLDGS